MSEHCNDGVAMAVYCTRYILLKRGDFEHCLKLDLSGLLEVRGTIMGI